MTEEKIITYEGQVFENSKSEIKWLGLCLRSESDQPHEWLPIGWAIRNRVLDKRFPDTYKDVILQMYQYSYFNQFSHLKEDLDKLYEESKKGYAGEEQGWRENNLSQAEQCAAEVVFSKRWHAPFNQKVCHYYSPRSMPIKNSVPHWAKTGKAIPVSGIDPNRFIFVADVQ